MIKIIKPINRRSSKERNNIIDPQCGLRLKEQNTGKLHFVVYKKGCCCFSPIRDSFFLRDQNACMQVCMHVYVKFSNDFTCSLNIVQVIHKSTSQRKGIFRFSSAVYRYLQDAYKKPRKKSFLRKGKALTVSTNIG